MPRLSTGPLAVGTLIGGLAPVAPAGSQKTGAWGSTWNNPNSGLISHFVQHGVQVSQLCTSLTSQRIGQKLARSPEEQKQWEAARHPVINDWETQAVRSYLLETGREAALHTRNPEAQRKIRKTAGGLLAFVFGKNPGKAPISSDGFALRK